MQHYIEAVLTTNAILVPVLLVFTLLPIGLIVLAVGTARAGVLPGWLAALMPLGMVGVAGSLQYPPLLVISALALLASFGFVGPRLLRTPSAPVAEERPVRRDPGLSLSGMVRPGSGQRHRSVWWTSDRGKGPTSTRPNSSQSQPE